MGGIDWLWVQIALTFVGLARIFSCIFFDWKASGPTVFDAGSDVRFRCLGLLFVAAQVWGAVRFEVSLISWTAMSCCSGLIFASMCGRTQIRENGIWYMSSLVPWDQVRDIVWSTETEVHFLRFGRIAAPIKITIPASEKDHVQQFLEERLEERWSSHQTDPVDQDDIRDVTSVV